MRFQVWISAFSSFLLSLGLLQPTKALPPWESKAWLSLYKPSSPLRLSDGIRSDLEAALEESDSSSSASSSSPSSGRALMNAILEENVGAQEVIPPWVGTPQFFKVEDEENANDHEEDFRSDGEALSASLATRWKRVFLSRGWMAGGYKAPMPSPNRFTRRPQALVQQPPARFTQPNPESAAGGGEAHYAALVPNQPQQSPPFRRFHSIFTSGMWTPLGKRSRAAPLIPLHTQDYYY